jgi:SagB-type dehydrogenase family enzyme
MKTTAKQIVGATVLLLTVATCCWAGQELVPIQLPKPQLDGGKPLMQALKLRATSRSFSPQSLSLQTIGNLLWAAGGINRPEEKKRTTPSAMNWQEIDLFVVMENGVYFYNPIAHELKPVVSGDFRTLTGNQEFIKEAPLTIVFVADLNRMGKTPPDKKEPFAWADAAFGSQNVYLFCASEGLATGVRASIDKPALAKAMKLADNQLIVFAMSVGLPKK